MGVVLLGVAGVQQRIAGRRVAVARLAAGARDHEPLPMRGQRHRNAGHGPEFAGLAGAREVEEHGLVHMAADLDARRVGMQALDRFRPALHIVPAGRVEGIGMHEQDLAGFAVGLQRQLGQKAQLGRVELGAGPVDNGACVGVHGRRAAGGDRLIMVAAHHHTPLRRQGHGLRHDIGRVGTVADEVAQQRKAGRALSARIGQHRLESMAVGMDVGDQGPAHGAELATRD
mmetsp:Transcript_10601/g.43300  ORF Transcript_10601/g.43300 Transcript_10601/m.43300 type:complete len:229 (-) Transcript_10601:647-1333(-)